MMKALFLVVLIGIAAAAGASKVGELMQMLRIAEGIPLRLKHDWHRTVTTGQLETITFTKDQMDLRPEAIEVTADDTGVTLKAQSPDCTSSGTRKSLEALFSNSGIYKAKVFGTVGKFERRYEYGAPAEIESGYQIKLSHKGARVQYTPTMLSRTIARVGSVIGRSAETGLLSKSSRSSVALNSTQAADSSNGSTEKFELKDPKGVRVSGEAYMNMVRERVGVKEGEEEWQVPHPAFDSLLKEYDGLIEESKDWKDRYTRALAETENVRRRGIKQVEDTKVFAVQGFCKDLLEVADILDLAVGSVKEDQLANASTEMKTLFDGVKMTQTVLLKTFAKHGLRPSNPIGEQFDPNLHEAVFQIPKEQAKHSVGQIEHVMKIGYILKERPVRAAQVGVVKE